MLASSQHVERNGNARRIVRRRDTMSRVARVTSRRTSLRSIESVVEATLEAT